MFPPNLFSIKRYLRFSTGFCLLLLKIVFPRSYLGKKFSVSFFQPRHEVLGPIPLFRYQHNPGFMDISPSMKEAACNHDKGELSHISLRSYELQPSRLLCPWGSSGKNTGVDSHFLLQGIFPTQGLNSCLLCF